MNSNLNWHFLFLAVGLNLVVLPVSYSQESPPKIEFESSAGVLFFDRGLSFETSPALGLGAGYNFTRVFQFNLALIYTPAQQQISAAASKINTNISVYQYTLSLKLRTPTAVIWRLKPFIKLGAGGIIFDPQTSSTDSIDIGGGLMIPLNFPTDHKFMANFGGGFSMPLSRRFLLNLEYQKYFYRLNLDNGVGVKTVTAHNNYLGARFAVSF